MSAYSSGYIPNLRKNQNIRSISLYMMKTMITRISGNMPKRPQYWEIRSKFMRYVQVGYKGTGLAKPILHIIVYASMMIMVGIMTALVSIFLFAFLLNNITKLYTIIIIDHKITVGNTLAKNWPILLEYYLFHHWARFQLRWIVGMLDFIDQDMAASESGIQGHKYRKNKRAYYSTWSTWV